VSQSVRADPDFIQGDTLCFLRHYSLQALECSEWCVLIQPFKLKVNVVIGWTLLELFLQGVDVIALLIDLAKETSRHGRLSNNILNLPLHSRLDWVDVVSNDLNRVV